MTLRQQRPQTTKYGSLKHSHPYKGQTVVLTSMHGKELAIADIFRSKLDMTLTCTTQIDTDQLGTFTGDIPRPGTMYETAVAKARLGLAGNTVSLGLASEGSFGPDPTFPFIAISTEMMVFVDEERGLILSDTLVTLETNYASKTIISRDDLSGFLDMVGFPAHALIVRPKIGSSLVFKGINTFEALRDAFTQCEGLNDGQGVIVSTDMRAHMNPTRMRIIGMLAHKIADRIHTLCPNCNSPGFGVVGHEKGLPCQGCGQPTQLIHYEICGCQACDFRRNRPRSDSRVWAKEGECAYCNP